MKNFILKQLDLIGLILMAISAIAWVGFDIPHAQLYFWIAVAINGLGLILNKRKNKS